MLFRSQLMSVWKVVFNRPNWELKTMRQYKYCTGKYSERSRAPRCLPFSQYCRSVYPNWICFLFHSCAWNPWIFLRNAPFPTDSHLASFHLSKQARTCLKKASRNLPIDIFSIMVYNSESKANLADKRRKYHGI